jgi:hypothetical protein
MIRILSTGKGQAENSHAMAKANLAMDLTPPGRISVGGEAPRAHLGALASVTVWMAGTVLSTLLPPITLHASKGLLNSAESLAVVSIQLLMTTCFTARAAKSADGLIRRDNAE